MVHPEKRQHPRHTGTRLRVRFSLGVQSPDTAAECSNISLGGMFITTGSPAPFQSTIRVVVDLPTTGAPIIVSAVVRWVTKEGMGVQFDPMGAQATHDLTEFLGSLAGPPST